MDEGLGGFRLLVWSVVCEEEWEGWCVYIGERVEVALNAIECILFWGLAPNKDTPIPTSAL